MSGRAEAMTGPPAGWRRYRAFLGLILLAILSVGPLLFEPLPVHVTPQYRMLDLVSGRKALVVALLLGAIIAGAWGDNDYGIGRGAILGVGILALLAGLMTLWHFYLVDFRPGARPGRWLFDWQLDMYERILNRVRVDDAGNSFAPHMYRPLPFGFVRSLHWTTGDLVFSYLAYRWFFSFWFLWGCYRFVHRFHGPALTWLAVLVILLLYPFSVAYYMGQWTDPLSHALFVLAFLYVVEDRWVALALTLALGMAAKETAIIVVPAYFACYWRQGFAAWWKTAVLGLACVAAFLAVHLPLGWSPGVQSLNNTQLMVTTNLGIGAKLYVGAPGEWTTLQNYLHVALFIGVFVPPILWHWRRLDARLRALVVVTTPLLFASSLCFSWLYESRNYIPLLPVLLAAALPPARCRLGQGQEIGNRANLPATLDSSS